MYIVTGGAGFIGSHLVRGLNARGITDILVVDHLERSAKFLNLRHGQIADYMDKQEFRAAIESGRFEARVDAIFHQGACSDTMEYNGVYMMDNNFTYSKMLLRFALAHQIPFIYASSAAAYGDSATFIEQPAYEKPLNIYGYSKLVFDQYVRRVLPDAPSAVVGLRYFNVYGPHEAHKGRMASMAHQALKQLKATGIIQLYEGSGGYAAGEQRRDFVCVDDLVSVNLFFAAQPRARGIFNVGTGQSRSFNELARTLIQLHGRGEIQYMPFPEGLRDKYQNFTEANLTALRAAGYTAPFISLEEGLARLAASD
jgi:ADP-L-glycero-D-manno-heptose 6-epimerase